jgi:hypothetical protein
LGLLPAAVMRVALWIRVGIRSPTSEITRLRCGFRIPA